MKKSKIAIIKYSNSPEFNTKLEIGNNSAAEFDTKFSGFRLKFGNIIKFSIEFGYRIIADFEFDVKFGPIAVFYNCDFRLSQLESESVSL